MTLDDIKMLTLAQYAHSPRLLALAIGAARLMHVDDDVDYIYNKIINIGTASGIGLDAWGVIVDLPRYAPIEVNDDSMGFDEGGWEGFDTLPMAPDSSAMLSYIPDAQYRRLILVKAAANLLPTTVYNVNKLLKLLIPNATGIKITGVGRADVELPSNTSSTIRYMLSSNIIIQPPSGVVLTYI